jgi:CheY-like chemotaxis protein
MGATPNKADPLGPRAASRPLRVLIADDSRDTVDSLSFILRDEGHVVHAVYTGSEVLPAARLFRPDAILLDIAIPGMSGYAAAQVIRSAFLDSRRPLMIAMSGVWKEPPDLRIAHQVGFDHHLRKPYDSAEVLRLLEPLQHGA